MVKNLIGLALPLFLTACATSAKIESKVDKFTNGRTATTEPIPVIRDVEKQVRVSCGTVDLCVTFKKIMNGDSVKYEASVLDGGEFKPPVDALKKDSLKFNVDGKIYALSTQTDAKSTEASYPGILTRITAQNVLYEDIPLEVMQSVAAGKDVKVQLKGSSREKVGYLPKVGSEALSNLIIAQ